MSNPSLVSLKSVTLKIGSGATPTGGGEAYKASGISLIRSQNVLDYSFSENGLAFIDEDQAAKLSNVEVMEGDVLLNITGDSVARCCQVPKHLLPARVNQHVAIIRADKSKAINSFLKYYLLNEKENLLIFSEVGATRRALTKGLLEEFEILLPPLPEQEAIAEVLSSLDDKIDLLHRNNRTMEEISATLYRKWFVEDADDSWGVCTLDELFDIGIGRTPPRKEHQWFSTDSKDVKWVSIKDMGNLGAFLTKTAEFLTLDAVKKFNIPVVPANTTLLSFKMTLGRVSITTESMLSNEAIAHFKVREKSDVFTEFLYLFLKTYRWEQLGSTSSIVEAINSKMIKAIEIALPSDDKLRNFKTLVVPYFDKMYSNQVQIEQLETIRNTLLPKLMSGAVRVNM